jgi:hypothetical protein
VLAEHPIDFGERDATVDSRLAGAQQIQVRTVQDQDLHDRRELSISGRRRAS